MDRWDKCWDIKECPHKEQCNVYPHHGGSCWLIKDKSGSLLVNDDDASCPKSCESCEVYQWRMALRGPVQNGSTTKPFQEINS